MVHPGKKKNRCGRFLKISFPEERLCSSMPSCKTGKAAAYIAAHSSSRGSTNKKRMASLEKSPFSHHISPKIIFTSVEKSLIFMQISPRIILSQPCKRPSNS
jgi:hypothetical protein